jgi:hypothetical protein
VFAGRTANIVTASCAAVGLAALAGMAFLVFAGGLEYLKFALEMVFFVAFLMGSYWWMVVGPGRRL